MPTVIDPPRNRATVNANFVDLERMLRSYDVAERLQKKTDVCVQRRTKNLEKVDSALTPSEWSGLIGVAILYAVAACGLQLSNASFSLGYCISAVVNLSIAAWIQRRKRFTRKDDMLATRSR